jgi:hypothetical protein
MSEGNDGYYFDQQAADDAAYEAYHAPAPAADINSLYQELLGRAPDPTGIAANAGASADTIRESILASPEYNNQNVNTIYQDLLGRAPDPTGIAANAGATPEQIRQSIFGSAEYQNQNPYQAPPSGFFDMPGYGAENADPYSIVGNMLMQGNQLVYNVTPIQDESGYVSGYKRTDTGEGIDLKTLNKSITGYDKEITDLYENLLGRAPDVSEVIAYNNQLKSGEVNLGDVYQGFMQSPERLSRVMPFLDPNADVNTKFEQGVAGFDAKGLSREGYLDGLPTHYVDPKTGKLAAWFGTLGDSMQTDDYTWHTVDELRAIPDAKVYLAQESKRDVGADWRSLGRGAAMVAGTVLAPELFAYLAPAAAAGGAGLTAAEAATLMGGTLSEAGAAATMGAGGAGAFSTGSALADAAIKNAVMNAGMTAIQGGKPGDILKAGVIGAVSGGAGSAIGDLGLGSLGTTLAKAGVQAGITGLTGGNVTNSLIASAVGAALPVALDKIIPEGTFDGLPTLFKNALTSATARAVTAAATGGDISDAALNGIVGSAADAAMDYVADATGFKGLTLAQAADKIGGYFQSPDTGSGSSESDDGAGGVPDTSGATRNSELSDQLFKDVFGSPSTTTPTGGENNAPFDLDTGYRAEAFPVAAPVGAEFAPLEAGPLDKETQAQVDAIAAKQQQKNYSAGLNAKLSNVNSIINLVPDTLGLFTGIAKSIEAEIKAATSALANSTEYTRPTDAQVAAIFKAAQDFYAPIRDLVFDATQVDAASPEAKSGLITKTLNGIGEIMHAASVPIAQATGMPVEYVESVLALAGPKIVGKTFNVASALGADIASGSWGNALSNVMNKAESLGIVPKTEMYVVDPKQGLGSLGAKPFAEAESGIAALLKDYRPTNTPLLDSLLAKEKPAMSLVDSLLKDYKPADPIPVNVKSQIKTSVDNVYTGLAKDAPSVPMSEFLQTLVYGGASLKDVGTAVDLAMQGSGGGGGTNTPDAIIQEVSKATEKLDDAIKVPATFAFLVNAGILGVTPSTAIESGWVTDTGELTDAGTKYLAEIQPYPQEQLQLDPLEQLQPAQQEQPALQTETQPLLKEPVNKVKEFEDPPAPPPPPPKPPTPPPPLPPTVYPSQQPPVSKSEEIDPVDGESIDVTAIEGDPESPANKAKAKKQSKLRFNQSLGKALQAVQIVSAKTPPGAEIDYLYDIGSESIFAPTKGQSKYLPREAYYDPKIERQYAQGGMVAFDEGGNVTDETRALMYNPKLSQRGKDRMGREYPEDPSMVSEIAAGFHPVIGPALSAKDFKEAVEEDNYLGMGLAALGMIPIAGGAIKGYNRLVKPALRERALEKELVANYGKIPKGKPIPEGYIGGPDAPIPRFPNAESQAGYYAQPKFQTDYGREFTHDLIHSSPSPSITSFNPSVSIDNKGNRFATLNPDKARGASGNPLMAGGHAADDITTFLSNSPHYSQQYLPSNFDIPVGFPMVQGMPIPKETYTSGATMYPVSARLGNVYDPTMPEASKIANSFLDSLTQPKGMSDKDFKHYKQQFGQGLRNGEWQAIESAPFRSFLKEQGFDSFAYLKGSGKEQVKNYGVFEPNRVRGKFAEFDPAAARESDIMKANGGLIDLLRSK